MKSYQHLGFLVLAIFVLTVVISSRSSHANEPSVELSSSSVTSEDMDRRADELVALLDSVVEPVLKAHRPGRSYEDELYRHLKEAAGMEARDVLNLELPDGRTVMLAYNIPLTLSGSSRRLVIVLEGNALVLRIKHEEISLEERVARESLAEEKYGWKDDLLVLLDRRTVAEDQHAMQEIP